MKFYLLLIIFFVNSLADNFVLLDVDDPNLEETAKKIIPNKERRQKSIKMAKFRRWLKYDVDCSFITRKELELRIVQGRCPIPKEDKISEMKLTTMEPKKSIFLKKNRKKVKIKDDGLFSHKKKEKVIRSIVGNNKFKIIDLTPVSDTDIEVTSGSVVTLKCDEEKRSKNKKSEDIIEWFVNGQSVKTSWFDWRISISADGSFGLWPIEYNDAGHFECIVNGQLRASVNIIVVSMSKALFDGLINYLFVSLIFGMATIVIGSLLGLMKKRYTETEVDKMEEFLAEHVFKTDEMAKENIADILKGQGKIGMRNMIEEKGNHNRSTIRLLIQNPHAFNNSYKGPKKMEKELKNSHSDEDKPRRVSSNTEVDVVIHNSSSSSKISTGEAGSSTNLTGASEAKTNCNNKPSDHNDTEESDSSSDKSKKEKGKRKTKTKKKKTKRMKQKPDKQGKRKKEKPKNKRSGGGVGAAPKNAKTKKK